MYAARDPSQSVVSRGTFDVGLVAGPWYAYYNLVQVALGSTLTMEDGAVLHWLRLDACGHDYLLMICGEVSWRPRSAGGMAQERSLPL